MDPRLGAHVARNTMVQEAAVTGSEVVQMFLSSNRSWTDPVLDEDFVQHCTGSGLAIYVHAPYLVNPASLNPQVRARSRSALQAQTRAAARIGASGMIVHGGHPTGSGTLADGIAGWLEVLHGWEPDVPLLVENTAGGSAAVARRFDSFARLFDALSTAGHTLGICLDTCHAWAAGEDLTTSVERLRAFAGRIDLVHVNDSRDPFGSARDRHENLGRGTIPFEEICAVVAAACCDALVETPNGPAAMGEDLALLRTHLRPA